MACFSSRAADSGSAADMIAEMTATPARSSPDCRSSVGRADASDGEHGSAHAPRDFANQFQSACRRPGLGSRIEHRSEHQHVGAIRVGYSCPRCIVDGLAKHQVKRRNRPCVSDRYGRLREVQTICLRGKRDI